MDLTNRATHFEFGENWAEYARLIDEKRLESAIQNVESLVGDLKGKSFLDIGSGSGLFSLAALRLGASDLLAVDIDENSVATTKSVLSSYKGAGAWSAQQFSVFDLSSTLGSFDVVYSWGVLHHTGDMWRAIQSAAAMVKGGGTFAFALYEKTPICQLWEKEKQFYAKASPATQKSVRTAYKVVYGASMIARGINPLKRMREQRERGMNPDHDIHDWLGGFPYESTSLVEVAALMAKLGFERVLVRPVRVHALGALGTGCSEYVYRRLRDDQIRASE